MVEPGQRLGHDEQADARRDQLDGVRGGGGALDGGLTRRPLPVEDVVEWVEDDLVGQVLGRHLVDRRDDVVLGDDDDRGLGVEGIALRTVRSTGSRTKPASAPPSRSTSAASAAVTEWRVRGTSGKRSFQVRTHLAGVTPGT